MTDELIVLADGWNPKARAVPDSWWSKDEGGYVIRSADLTPRGAMVALRLFPELLLSYPQLAETRDLLVQDVRPVDNATPFDTRVDADYVRSALREDGHELYDFQALDLGYLTAVLQEHGAGYMGWERGLGKTLGTFAIAEELGAERALVVAPNTAKGPVWAAEAERFWPYAVEVLPNIKKKREACLLRCREYRKRGEPFLLVVHYEALDIVAGNGRGWDKFGEWDLVVADEVHRIKNPKAKMSRAIKKIPAQAKLGLSGSVIENHADELFSPLQWLFPTRYRSRWRDWNDRFLDYVEGGYGKLFVGIKPEQLDALRQELGVFMVYRRKEDELDLPERTDQDLYVELSPAQRKAYDELVVSCMTKLEDDTIVAARDGLPMLAKLRQIATGLDLVAENVTDSTKLNLAMDLILDSPDEAFVVFGWYKASIRALASRLEGEGVEAFIVDGDVPQDKRNELIARFQEGEGRVMLGTLSTMGESVNLQRASQAVFLDRSWNPATNVQAEDRIYRLGQEKPVTITHIVAKDTADEYRVMPTIANKEALRRMILGG
jgi:superfamily II DNA or RNA helicase